MLDNNDVLKLARNAVEKMFLEKGREFTFPFDLIWQYTEDESQIPSTARPHQVKRLLSEEYIEKTGGITRALSSKRAGSATPEYRFGRALRDKLLKFTVVENLPTLDETNIFPIILLQKKDWDDFGYRTAYEATLAISPQKSVSLGDIKILIGNTPSEQSKLPDTFFSMHSHKFCSLGQSIEYYKNVAALDSDIRNQYLKGIKDVVFDIELKQNFQENAGFKLSLARFSSAMQALSDAPELFTNAPKVEIGNNSTGPSFTFQTKLSREANDLSINFNFNATPEIPNRINVVIGYNGTGKTQLLSKLATVTSGYGYKRKRDLLLSETGKFIDSAPNFGGVVVVSYSAFDTFEIPGQDESERSHLDIDGGFFGYTYCGLRKVLQFDNNEPVYGLKDHREIRAEYASALQRIQEQGRTEVFLKILGPITNEASFQRIGISQAANSFLNDQNFLLLSTGHKIVLTIVAQLTSLLEKERRMLVIMDEPEAHLHPPLLASLLHSFRICMEEFDAYAIISTHSPVVLQETPSKYVRILRRIGNSSQVSLPAIETFGENIGVITKDIFNLSDETTDWHDVLKALAENHPIETIEDKFGKRLGFSARSYVMSLRDER